MGEVFHLIDEESGRCLLGKVRVARGFGDRLVGLMFRRQLDPEEGLIFEKCTSIHTCFMRCRIDAVFVDEGWRISDWRENLGPWRFVWGRHSRHVVEMSAGSITRLGLRKGQALLRRKVPVPGSS